MKKFFAFLLVLIITASASFGVVTAGAVGATTGEVDVVFLVDSSRSMAKSDPDLIRLEAIKLFSDLCSLGSTKIGFVLFGSEIIYSQAPEPINTEEDRTALKKKVDELGELKGTTDIGMAVLHAVDLLTSDDYSGNGKFIVFLSDGKTVITDNDAGRTLDDSRSDLTEGIVNARNAGIPIYTIGLNANGDVDEAELQNISSSTYADSTYMTDSPQALSGILSDIYVRHTGAETAGLDDYTADGEYRDTSFEIKDATVAEANIVIMHSALPNDVKLYDTEGAEVAFDGTSADISWNTGYTLVKVYEPKQGSWKLSVKAPEGTAIDINYIYTHDYRLDFTLYTDKAVGAGTKLKFIASLTDPENQPITDENIITSLLGRAIVRNSDTGDSAEIPLSYSDKKFTGEYVLDSDSPYSAQVSLYNSNTDVRSDIIELSAGDEQYKEPEGPLKLILLCAAGVLVLIVLIVMLMRYLKSHIRMFSGRLNITVTAGGIPTAPMAYDFAKKAPGKRKVMLSDVMKTLFEKSEAADAIPHSAASSIAISMTDSGDLRMSKAKGIEYSGGLTLGNNIIIGHANRVTMRWTDKNGETNLVIVQYLRT